MSSQEEVRDKAGFVLDLIRPVFPGQTRFLLGDAAAGCAHRFHFLFWHNRKWILLPDARVSFSSLIPRIYDKVAAISDDNRSLLEHPFFFDAESICVGIAPPGHTIWPIIGRPLAEVTFALFPSAQKLVGIYFDQQSRSPCRVLKVPLDTHANRNLTREAELLREFRERNLRVGPDFITSGEIEYQSGQSSVPRRFCYFLQDYLYGEQPGIIDIQAFIAFLNKLIIPGSTITLTAMAVALKTRLDNLNINGNSKGRIQELLSSIQHDDPLPASIQHGDLSPRNLFRQSTGEYLAVDWELASRPSFGFLDLLSLRLRNNYFDQEITSFNRIYDDHIDALEACLPGFFPGERPPLHEPLALQFCQYYIDRAESFSELAGPVLQRLDRILQSRWITE